MSDIKINEEINSIYSIGLNKSSFPYRFNFSKLMLSKLDSLETLPNILIIIVPICKDIYKELSLNDRKYTNNKISCIDYFFSIIENICTDNLDSKIYNKVQFYSFDNNLRNEGIYSLNDVKHNIKNIKLNIIKNTNFIKEMCFETLLSNLLYDLDDNYNNYFNNCSRIENRRISKII